MYNKLRKVTGSVSELKMYPIISGIKHKKGSANIFNRNKYKFKKLKENKNTGNI